MLLGLRRESRARPTARRGTRARRSWVMVSYSASDPNQMSSAYTRSAPNITPPRGLSQNIPAEYSCRVFLRALPSVLCRGEQERRAAGIEDRQRLAQGGALMALGSGIEWTESTWNPVTGCNKISPGCKYCYAERMAERLQAMGQANYKDGFELTLQPKMLELPLQWKKPQTIFVNSMSDLFHKDVPLEYIQRVFDVMRRAHWHRFQVLTKRADRLAELSPQIDWPRNVWMGVSVENADYVHRIDNL